MYFRCIITNLILLGISIPLFLKKIPPNQWYGIRTAKTLSDENIWYNANYIAGIDMLVVSIFMMFFLLAIFFLENRISSNVLEISYFLALTIAVTMVTLHCIIYVNKII